MSNEAGLAKFFLGLAAVVVGTSAVASTATGISCHYIGKKLRDEEAKPKTVYLQKITVDKKEYQALVVENYREERFGFLRQQDGTYKSLEQELKELEETQKKVVDDLKNKMGGN